MRPFDEADAEAQILNRRYPHARFAVFQRRVVYDSVTDTKRRLDRKPGAPKDGFATFNIAPKVARAG